MRRARSRGLVWESVEHVDRGFEGGATGIQNAVLKKKRVKVYGARSVNVVQPVTVHVGVSRDDGWTEEQWDADPMKHQLLLYRGSGRDLNELAVEFFFFFFL